MHDLGVMPATRLHQHGRRSGVPTAGPWYPGYLSLPWQAWQQKQRQRRRPNL